MADRSLTFLAPAWDDGEVEIQGERLANYLALTLSAQGAPTHTPIAEDWGWVVPLGDPKGFWIGCGFDGDQRFRCFVHPHGPSAWRGWRRIDISGEVAAIEAKLEAAVRASGEASAIGWQDD